MDAKERHELKENELAEFLGNFGEWWSKHGNTTLITILLCLSVYIGFKIYRSSTQRAHDNAWYDLAASTNPRTLEQVAQTYSIPAVRAQAQLRAADMFNQESLAPADAESDLTPEQKLDQAEAMYRNVMDGAEHPVFRLNAMMGLAATAETRRHWDQAREQYDQVIALAEQSSFNHFADMARTRIALLPKLQSPVEFAPDPPATQPADAGSAENAKAEANRLPASDSNP